MFYIEISPSKEAKFTGCFKQSSKIAAVIMQSGLEINAPKVHTSLHHNGKKQLKKLQKQLGGQLLEEASSHAILCLFEDRAEKCQQWKHKRYSNHAKSYHDMDCYFMLDPMAERENIVQDVLFF